mmetsp:Transcript_6867/g.15063  ORF Transcript_6867/g.15063 Transcript_6867/m.15063 type:complete len:296 (-) Transcript_6867:1970-2857(-)
MQQPVAVLAPAAGDRAAQIYESSEGGHVAHRASDLAARLQVRVKVQRRTAQHLGRRGVVVTHCAPHTRPSLLPGHQSRLQQPLPHLLQCARRPPRRTLAQRLSGGLFVQRGQLALCVQSQHAPGQWVVLRVNVGGVQRLAAPPHPQEACTVLKRLRAHTLDRQQTRQTVETAPTPADALALAAALTAATAARCDDFPHVCVVQPGHVVKQVRRGGVQVRAHEVNTVLHHLSQALLDALVRQVVLVHAHAQAVRLHLDQFAQGVCQPASDADCAQKCDVQQSGGELLAAALGGGVN